jgi:hypothetical protein
MMIEYAGWNSCAQRHVLHRSKNAKAQKPVCIKASSRDVLLRGRVRQLPASALLKTLHLTGSPIVAKHMQSSLHFLRPSSL